MKRAPIKTKTVNSEIKPPCDVAIWSGLLLSNQFEHLKKDRIQFYDFDVYRHSASYTLIFKRCLNWSFRSMHIRNAQMK